MSDPRMDNRRNNFFTPLEGGEAPSCEFDDLETEIVKTCESEPLTPKTQPEPEKIIDLETEDDDQDKNFTEIKKPKRTFKEKIFYSFTVFWSYWNIKFPGDQSKNLSGITMQLKESIKGWTFVGGVDNGGFMYKTTHYPVQLLKEFLIGIMPTEDSVPRVRFHFDDNITEKNETLFKKEGAVGKMWMSGAFHRNYTTPTGTPFTVKTMKLFLNMEQIVQICNIFPELPFSKWIGKTDLENVVNVMKKDPEIPLSEWYEQLAIFRNFQKPENDRTPARPQKPQQAPPQMSDFPDTLSGLTEAPRSPPRPAWKNSPAKAQEVVTTAWNRQTAYDAVKSGKNTEIAELKAANAKLSEHASDLEKKLGRIAIECQRAYDAYDDIEAENKKLKATVAELEKKIIEKDAILGFIQQNGAPSSMVSTLQKEVDELRERLAEAQLQGKEDPNVAIIAAFKKLGFHIPESVSEIEEPAFKYAVVIGTHGNFVFGLTDKPELYTSEKLVLQLQ